MMGGPTMAYDVDADEIEVDENNPTDPWEEDTFSLSSSVMQFTYENGRRYHGYHEGIYWGPNDAKQNDHLDLLHQVFLMRMQKLFSSPIEDPKHILDIGTGTGIWAIDVADEFPNCEVFGTDLSPTQPEWTPPNVHFEIDDAENKWLYEKDFFDLVHVRMLAGSISDWPRLVKQAYRHIKPGGWIELVEVDLPYMCDDGTHTEDSKLHEWAGLLIDAGRIMGRPIGYSKNIKSWVIDQGFENVHENIVKFPLGPWALDKNLKELGKYNLMAVLDGLEGFSLALFTRILNWKADEVQVYLAALRREFMDPNRHIYYNAYIIYGQKPLHPKTASPTPVRDFSIKNLLNDDEQAAGSRAGATSPYAAQSPTPLLAPVSPPPREASGSPELGALPAPPTNMFPSRSYQQ